MTPTPEQVYYAINLPPEEAIKYFQSLGYEISWDWREQARIADSQAFTIAKVAKLDLLQDIKSLVEKALVEGTTFHEFRKEFEAKLSGKGWTGARHRIETIYRTNIQSAYMEGRRKTQLENADERPYLMYVAVADSKTRPEHLALNGKIYPIDDPIWNIIYPPLKVSPYNCRCRTRALNAEQVAERGGVSEPPPDIYTPKPWPDYSKYSPEIKALV